MAKKFKRNFHIFTFALLLAFVGVMFAMGRLPICECGYIKLWQADNFSPENSQHISDWYSFSHIIHGFIFFGAISWLFKKMPTDKKLFIATSIEVFWEILENTPMIINRYRTTTASLTYNGDSIINSFFDILAMILGFYLAKKLPIWASVLLIIAMEIGVGYIIRDNLTLNIIMLIYPSPAIQAWQLG